MKRFVFVFLGMIPLLELEAQHLLDLASDTIFCISIYYNQNNDYPDERYLFFMKEYDDCHVNLSNPDSLNESICKGVKNGTYHLVDLESGILSLAFLKMTTGVFSDSSLCIQREAYNICYSTWMSWAYDTTAIDADLKFITETNDYVIISIQKFIAYTKQNINGYSLALGVIKEVIPIYLNYTCIKDKGMVLSKECFY